MNPQYKTFDEIPWWNKDSFYPQQSYGRSQAQPMQAQMQQPMNYAASYQPQGLLGGGNNKNPGTLGAEMYTNYVNNLLMKNVPQVAQQPPQGVFGFDQVPVRKSWSDHLADRGGGSA